MEQDPSDVPDPHDPDVEVHEFEGTLEEIVDDIEDFFAGRPTRIKIRDCEYLGTGTCCRDQCFDVSSVIKDLPEGTRACQNPEANAPMTNNPKDVTCLGCKETTNS